MSATVRQYNILRLDYLTRERQKEFIRRYWGEKFVRFVPCEDRRYISFLARA